MFFRKALFYIGAVCLLLLFFYTAGSFRNHGSKSGGIDQDSSLARVPAGQSQIQRPPSGLRQSLGSPLVQPKSLKSPVGAFDIALEDLHSASSLPWRVTKDRSQGRIARMADGLLPLDPEPKKAVSYFLSRFGGGLLGISSESAGSMEVIDHGDGAQVIVSQRISGLDVFGARINFVFNKDGALVYLRNDSFDPIASVPESVPRMHTDQSALVARERFLSGLSNEVSARLAGIMPFDFFQDKGRLGYWLRDGSLFLVYRFELSLVDFSLGDYEFYLDANDGKLLSLRSLSRK